LEINILWHNFIFHDSYVHIHSYFNIRRYNNMDNRLTLIEKVVIICLLGILVAVVGGHI
jgi:hypothetical protein